mmetsp:Transcript_21641/g.31496  ORF Transcript_21641/g.31496 Transcript_21641/m.31496 type:complete len:127 (-) Transcript_21641:222-602(-)
MSQNSKSQHLHYPMWCSKYADFTSPHSSGEKSATLKEKETLHLSFAPSKVLRNGHKFVENKLTRRHSMESYSTVYPPAANEPTRRRRYTTSDLNEGLNEGYGSTGNPLCSDYLSIDVGVGPICDSE